MNIQQNSPLDEQTIKDVPVMGDGSGLTDDQDFLGDELQLAVRNSGMPLEALQYPITPTGLHYLLIHWDIPHIDPATWRLTVDGTVASSLELSLEDLRNRPAVTHAVTMECAGNGRALMSPRPLSQPWFHDAIGTAEWTGTPLGTILEEAGLQSTTKDILFTGADWGIQGNEVQAYERSLSIDECMREGVLLAYEMNGQPILPQHGAPLRLIVPDWYGMTSVKWLTGITALDHQFEGYQMIGTYRYTQSSDDIGEAVTFKRPRALMIPPGVPDFATRERILMAGTVQLSGRAWTGRGQITRVQVSTNNGDDWVDATLEPNDEPYAWIGWSAEWEATPGRHTLCVRATDSNGESQPLDPFWNHQGMGNNVVQRVNVSVR